MEMKYDRNHPFFSKIKERKILTAAASTKQTVHLVLDIEGSGIHYFPGDSVGICPSNDPKLVQKTLKALHASSSDKIRDKHGVEMEFGEFLAGHANLKTVSKKFANAVLERLSGEAKVALDSILEGEHFKEELSSHEVWDFLCQYGEAHFTPQEAVELLMPLLPRFYSIASSQRAVGNEIHLTISYLNYETRGICRMGTCTNYLCNLAPIGEPCIPLYVHPANHFRIPEDPNAQLIMIGPGTGIAPFRGFIQEREARGDKGENWLFFGERTRAGEFYYAEELEQWVASGLLRLDLAFSRDQQEKVYVQHRMLQMADDLFRWLENGAYIYVCGDAHHMAKDVEAALIQIISEKGNLDEFAVKEYLKRLRSEKRYLRDVY